MPQFGKTTPELIKQNVYPVETHIVTSQDGYLLTVFRIPHGANDNTSNPSANKSVVFLMHGFLCSSSDWLMQQKAKALVYLLVDAGYDVWLGNARGSNYSLGHTTLNSSDSNSAYWDFSWHEMGKYDVPALIDYTLNITGQPNLYWIGHSMGNTMVTVALSLNPSYNIKIRTLYALAPTAYNKHANNILFSVFINSSVYETGYLALGQKQFIPKPVQEYAYELGVLCKPLASKFCIPLDLCSNVLFLIFGYDCPQVDPEMVPSILYHTPSTAAARVWAHYMQVHETGIFSAFDYSHTPNKSNMVEYGSNTPLVYNLLNVKAPVIFFSADGDNLVPPIDVCEFSKNIPGLKEHIQNLGSPNFTFNHIDMLYAKDANIYIYKELLDRMKPTPSGTNEIISKNITSCDKLKIV